MSIKYGESLMAKIGTQHEIDFTYASPKETTPGTPLVVPASEPADYTWTYTVESGDMPTIVGAYSSTVVVVPFCHGINLVGTAQTLNWRVLIDDVSVATGSSSITAGWYWSLTFMDADLRGVAVGKVIKVRLWAASDTYFDCKFYAMQVLATRIQVGERRKLIRNVKYYDSILPQFTGATNQSGYSTIGSVTNSTDVSISLMADYWVNMLYPTTTYGILRQYHSDFSTTTYVGNNNSFKYCLNSITPTKITWEED